MLDPLAEIVTLLQPSAPYSKVVEAAGRWQVKRRDFGHPFYCAILEGECRLSIDGEASLPLVAGDFVLVPSAEGFGMSSVQPPASNQTTYRPRQREDGTFRLGRQAGPADVRYMVGHCEFASPDAALLVSLLPRLIRIHGQARLATLVQWLRDESREQRPAREVVLSRLLEVLFIEALRASVGTSATPGLMRGLADARLAVAIRCMHGRPTHAWTVAELAAEAALSRSAFFERFNRTVGLAPMEYLLSWRMALAKNMLRTEQAGVAEVAERVGYSSASTFSVAFTRHVGVPPARYAREQAAA